MRKQKRKQKEADKGLSEIEVRQMKNILDIAQRTKRQVPSCNMSATT